MSKKQEKENNDFYRFLKDNYVLPTMNGVEEKLENPMIYVAIIIVIAVLALFSPLK